MPKFAGWEYNMHIMGLADRIKQVGEELALAEASKAEAAKRQALSISAQRLRTQELIEKDLGLQNEAKNELALLLDNFRVRSLLNQVIRIWGGGYFDQLMWRMRLGDKGYNWSSSTLAVRYPYNYNECVMRCSETVEGPADYLIKKQSEGLEKEDRYVCEGSRFIRSAVVLGISVSLAYNQSTDPKAWVNYSSDIAKSPLREASEFIPLIDTATAYSEIEGSVAKIMAGAKLPISERENRHGSAHRRGHL